MNQEYDIAKIIEDTPDERFLKYLQFSWDIFKATTEKINHNALYKTAATNEYSKAVGEATGAAVLAGGAIADFFLPGVGVVTKGVSKVVDKSISAVGGKIEKSHAHTSAKNIQKIVGSFNSENPKSYTPVTEAFADIFINFNLQMIYLLDPENLDFHLSKALFKFALDTVSKIFDGFNQLLNNKQQTLPEFFSKQFLISCFLSGKSEGGIVDKVRTKLPKKLFGKSLGGQLSKDLSTEQCFEFPLVRSKDQVYWSKAIPPENIKKFLYRYQFELEEPPKDFSPHSYLKFFEDFDVSKDNFSELTKNKEGLLKKFYNQIQSLRQRIDDTADALSQKIDLSKQEVIQYCQETKEELVAHTDASCKKVLKEIEDLKEKPCKYDTITSLKYFMIIFLLKSA